MDYPVFKCQFLVVGVLAAVLIYGKGFVILSVQRYECFIGVAGVHTVFGPLVYLFEYYVAVLVACHAALPDDKTAIVEGIAFESRQLQRA